MKIELVKRCSTQECDGFPGGRNSDDFQGCDGKLLSVWISFGKIAEV
jgi:hypothetical protein